MAKKLIKKKSKISVVKKRWYNLLAPTVFDHVAFGETLAADPAMLPGRSVKAALSTFMRASRRNSVEVTFRITEVKGSDCATEFEKLEIPGPYVKRLVRRAKKRIDDSFIVTTKDEVKVRLKPLVLVKDVVQRGVLTAIRKETQQFYTNLASELTFNELVNKVLHGETSKELKFALKKVQPVSVVEMRMLVRQRK